MGAKYCGYRAIAGRTVRVDNFSYLNQTKLSLHTLCRYQCTRVSRVGNRYVWQGGQTENQGGQTKKFFRRFAPNFIKQMFAHPGLKPCRRPCVCVCVCVTFNRVRFHLSCLVICFIPYYGVLYFTAYLSADLSTVCTFVVSFNIGLSVSQP